MRHRVENSTSSSEEWVTDDNSFSSTGKLVPGIQNQLTEVRLENHKLQVSDKRYVEKVFANVRTKVHRLEDDQVPDQRVNVLI